MHRREFLTSGTALGAAALAGCTSTGGGSDGGTEGTDESTGTPIDAHPAAADLDTQPILGETTESLIVAFEDPSCTLCRRFEENTYPKIVSEIVETGAASFVYRGYPIIYPWGEPAAHILEATHAADASAFWALKDHYYAEQSAFEMENVYERSQTFLDQETRVDAEAVVTAAESGEADEAVAVDLDAGETLGIGQTPEFYLFSDGVFRTTVRGAQGFSVFETALGA